MNLTSSKGKPTAENDSLSKISLNFSDAPFLKKAKLGDKVSVTLELMITDVRKDFKSKEDWDNQVSAIVLECEPAEEHAKETEADERAEIGTEGKKRYE